MNINTRPCPCSNEHDQSTFFDGPSLHLSSHQACIPAIGYRQQLLVCALLQNNPPAHRMGHATQRQFVTRRSKGITTTRPSCLCKDGVHMSRQYAVTAGGMCAFGKERHADTHVGNAEWKSRNCPGNTVVQKQDSEMIHPRFQVRLPTKWHVAAHTPQFPPVHHSDAVGVPDSRQAVSNHHTGAAVHDAVQSFLQSSNGQQPSVMLICLQSTDAATWVFMPSKGFQNWWDSC